MKGYGSGPSTVRVLDQLDVLLAKAETTSLLGRSGAGKSTLLGLIAGLILPDEGRIIAVFEAVHPSFVNRPCRTTITVWSTRAGRFVSLLADRALHFVPADLIVRVINRRCRRRRR